MKKMSTDDPRHDNFVVMLKDMSGTIKNNIVSLWVRGGVQIITVR